MKRRLKANRPIHEIFTSEVVSRYPRKPAFVDLERGGVVWTFSELDSFANQVANYFRAKGLTRKDVAVLFMSNSPEYVGFWLGLSKLGVVTALVNNNLRLDPLAHSIRIADAKCIIVGTDLQSGWFLFLLVADFKRYVRNT